MLHDRIKDQLKKGILLMLLASFTFSIMGALVKFSSTNLPSQEVVFFRSFVSLIFITIMMKIKGVTFKGNNVPLLVLRGLIGSIALLGYFYTVSEIKLGDAHILIQISPIFVVLFAYIFLREKVHKVFFILLIATLIGTTLIIKPDFTNFDNIPGVIGFFSAILAAGAYVLIRFLGKTNSSYLITLYFMGISTLLSFPIMIPTFVIPSFIELIAMIGVGLTSSVAQLLMTKAYSIEKAGYISMIGYSGVFFNIMWGYLFWSEMLDELSIIGGMLIITACISLNLIQNREKRLKLKEQQG